MMLRNLNRIGVALAALFMVAGAATAAAPRYPQSWTGIAPIAATSFSEIKIDNAAASGDTIVVGAVAGQTTKVYKIFLNCNAATNIVFKDGATTLTGAMPLGANGAIVLDFDGNAWFTGSANSNFVVNSSVATQCSGRAYYLQN